MNVSDEPSSSFLAKEHIEVPKSVKGVVSDRHTEAAIDSDSGNSDIGSEAASANTSMSSDVSESLRDFGSLEEISIDAATHEILVKVPSALVGRMIGRNGLVIKELQSLSGAFINMGKDGEQFKIARISGNFPETHICALFLVQKFTPRDATAKHEKIESLLRHFRKQAPEKATVIEQVTVPAEHVSRIIGKGGSALREVQERTRAKIEIPRHSVPSEQSRTLTVSGSRDDVRACVELLQSRIASRDDGPRSDHAVPAFQPTEYRQELMPPYQYGHPAPYYGTPYMPQFDYGYSPAPGYGYMMYPTMMPDMSALVLDDDQMVPTPSAPMAVPGYMPMMAPMYPSQPYYASPASSPSMSGMVLPQHETIMAVPAELIGRLIGRQGVAVKLLQSETKSRVDVLDAEPNTPPGTRYVRISALHPDNVAACQRQIQARIASHYGAQ